MRDEDAIQMMTRCKNEIDGLRGRVAYLEPLADAYETMRASIRLMTRQGEGMGHSEDLVRKLDDEIGKLRIKMLDPEQDPPD